MVAGEQPGARIGNHAARRNTRVRSRPGDADRSCASGGLEDCRSDLDGGHAAGGEATAVYDGRRTCIKARPGTENASRLPTSSWSRPTNPIARERPVEDRGNHGSRTNPQLRRVQRDAPWAGGAGMRSSRSSLPRRLRKRRAAPVDLSRTSVLKAMMSALVPNWRDLERQSQHTAERSARRRQHTGE